MRCISLSDPIRVPDANVCQIIANVSLQLEHLAVSFLVDASRIFDACQPLWWWPRLETVVLTSRLLTPHGNPEAIDQVLQNAAEVGKRMPNLITLEIWNGREALAALFRYEAPRRRKALLSWRATWSHHFQLPVVHAWKIIAKRYDDNASVKIVTDLQSATLIKSHADAILALQISKPVLRSISLQQIQIEQEVWESSV